MKLRHTIYANIALLMILNPGTPTFSAEDDSINRRDGRRGPPQVAFDACASSTEGDTCSFSGRNDEQLSGTCFLPHGRELVCRPDGHEERQGGKRGKERGREQAPE